MKIRSVVFFAAMALSVSLAHADEAQPWQSPDWEPIAEAERQPATEAEIEQVTLAAKSTDEGMSYLTGGFGVAERAWLAEAGADFPLRLEFSRGARGEFVSDVQVRLTHSAGEPVFQAGSDGPLMYVDLPDGRYAGEASFRGETRSFSVDVPARGQVHAHVNFP
ncbi:MAG: hypothetical protein ACOC00_01100 [Halothiobacillaceae bacterium]